MNKIDPISWKEDIPRFKESAQAFFAGEIKKNDYKGISGFFGSYAQHSGKESMLRLRMTAGRLTREKLAFIAGMIEEYQVEKVHFTTCQAVQLHDLKTPAVWEIMEKALDVDIVTIGGGGDFPRNVMCSPLSGVEKGEYFDVMPYAQAAADYLMNFVKAEKMPRKLKVCFSNSPKNLTHATFRDLGFVARPDGKFDVYSAGGLGNNPRLGVKMAEGIDPSMICYYIKAMWITFRTYGNYENRGKARTRYMQEILGSPEAYKKAFLEKLRQVFESGEDLKLDISISKEEDNSDQNKEFADNPRVIPQKQAGLYAVCWHPYGGIPKASDLISLNQALSDIPQAEVRLCPDESAYIINLKADQVEKILDITSDTAMTPFEASVSCIGASICQVGLRDSQALLNDCIKAVKEAGLPSDALPQIHISGCPSSCGTHQIGAFGFRGAAKKGAAGFMLYINGCEKQGKEALGREVGVILTEDIPKYIVEVGQSVASSGMDYAAWADANPNALESLAEKYL